MVSRGCGKSRCGIIGGMGSGFVLAIIKLNSATNS